MKTSNILSFSREEPDVVARPIDPKDCDHGDVDMDERCCLDCNKDMSEELCAQAEHDAEINEDR